MISRSTAYDTSLSVIVVQSSDKIDSSPYLERSGRLMILMFKKIVTGQLFRQARPLVQRCFIEIFVNTRFGIKNV